MEAPEGRGLSRKRLDFHRLGDRPRLAPRDLFLVGGLPSQGRCLTGGGAIRLAAIRAFCWTSSGSRAVHRPLFTTERHAVSPGGAGKSLLSGLGCYARIALTRPTAPLVRRTLIPCG
jgi:hypothetical protein